MASRTLLFSLNSRTALSAALPQCVTALGAGCFLQLVVSMLLEHKSLYLPTRYKSAVSQLVLDQCA